MKKKNITDMPSSKESDLQKKLRLEAQGLKKKNTSPENPEIDTPPKINIEPENDGLEDDFPLPGVYSQVPC